MTLRGFVAVAVADLDGVMAVRNPDMGLDAIDEMLAEPFPSIAEMLAEVAGVVSVGEDRSEERAARRAFAAALGETG